MTLLLPLPSKNKRKRAAPKIPFWHVQRGRGWRHQVTTGTSLFRSRFDEDLFASHPGWAVQLHYRRVFLRLLASILKCPGTSLAHGSGVAYCTQQKVTTDTFCYKVQKKKKSLSKYFNTLAAF